MGPLSTGPQKITCTSGSDISSTCVQECEPGYSLIGSTQRSCLLSGKWSGSEGTCKRTSCGAAKALQAMEDPYCTNTDKPGSTCYIRCPRGMSAFGTPYKQCHFNYQWFPPDLGVAPRRRATNHYRRSPTVNSGDTAMTCVKLPCEKM